jgi:ribonuclease HI
MNKNIVYRVYVDGSYNRHNKVGAYAFVVVDDGGVVYSEANRIVNARLLMGYQVGCECKAVVQALKWCISNDVVMDVYYDFANLRYWICDIWGEKPWKVNTDYSEAYRRYCLSNSRHIRSMIKVSSHTGDRYNEMADSMCSSCYE